MYECRCCSVCLDSISSFLLEEGGMPKIRDLYRQGGGQLQGVEGKHPKEMFLEIGQLQNLVNRMTISESKIRE